MNKQLDYEYAYHQALEENIKKTRDLVLNNDILMDTKINNYCKKYNLPKQFVRHKIIRDNIFAIQFAKDPMKQTFHQTLAAKFISEIDGVNSFVILPSSGSNALYVVNGTVGTDTEVNKNSNKSIDFYWQYNGYNFYASHKHTDNDGGSQDNQFHDLLSFLANASLSSDDNTIFLSIGDGAYYQKPYKRTHKVFDTRIDFMNSLYETDHSKALSINDSESYLLGL